MNENANRIEAFSDGVFAIAITLLILEIKVPAPARDAAGLWAGLLALWPSYLAFLFSFVVILIMWVNHHELLRMVSGVNYPFLFANGMLLLCVTFVPFPTAVLAAHLSSPDARAAVAFYCATMFVSSLMWNALFVTIVRYGLLRSSVSAETVARGGRITAACWSTSRPRSSRSCSRGSASRSTFRCGCSGSGWAIAPYGPRGARTPSPTSRPHTWNEDRTHVELARARRLSGESAKDKNDFAAMQARGEHVMGVDQYTSAHVFEDLPDGRRVGLDRDDPSDMAGIK